MQLLRILALAAGLLSSPVAATASGLERVNLEPMAHAEARLVVVDPSGNEFAYTPADIEALGTYRMVTTTPWRSEPAVFEGGLLQDLLKKHGLDGVAAIRVSAENEFESELGRAVWEEAPILLATRVDGQPHSRRERGPIQFVVAMDDFEGARHIAERHLVWMATRIEPAD